MSDGHAFDRYQEACDTLNHVRSSLRKRSETLSRVATAFRAASPSLKIEDLHEWKEIKDDPEAVRRADWLDFDALKSVVSSREEAVKQEAMAWNALGASRQERTKRCE